MGADLYHKIHGLWSYHRPTETLKWVCNAKTIVLASSEYSTECGVSGGRGMPVDHHEKWYAMELVVNHG